MDNNYDKKSFYEGFEFATLFFSSLGMFGPLGKNITCKEIDDNLKAVADGSQLVIPLLAHTPEEVAQIGLVEQGVREHLNTPEALKLVDEIRTSMDRRNEKIGSYMKNAAADILEHL